MIENSQDFSALAAALAAAQGEFPPIPRAAENPFFHSRYADLASVRAAVTPVLAAHGLAVTQHPIITDSGPGLTTMLVHESGQWISSTMLLCMAKADPQGQGSAITYARRYALSAILGVASEEDDDGQAAMPAQPTRQAHSVAGAGAGPTAKQRAALHAMAGEAGIPRSDLVRMACNVAGREVASSSELTREETSSLIGLVQDVIADRGSGE